MASRSTDDSRSMRDALSVAGFKLADAGALACATVSVTRQRNGALKVVHDDSVDIRLVDIAKSVANGVCIDGEVTVRFGRRVDGTDGIIDVDVQSGTR